MTRSRPRQERTRTIPAAIPLEMAASPPLSEKRWGVVEDGDLVSAVVGGDGVNRGGESGDVDVRVLDDDAVLNVDAADLAEGAGGGSVVGEELG